MKRPKLNLVQPDLIEVEPGKAKPRITEDPTRPSSAARASRSGGCRAKFYETCGDA